MKNQNKNSQESKRKGNENIIKKRITRILFSLLFLAFAPHNAWAGEGDVYIGTSAGFLFNSTINAEVTVEKELHNRNAMALFVEAGDRWHRDPVCGKICKDVFWDYYYWGGGAAYKWAVTQGRNSFLRIVTAAELGAYRRSVSASFDINIEWAYVLFNGVQLTLTQKNQYSIMHGDEFRNGLMAGIKIPF